MQAYQDFYNAPTVDIQKISAVTDMFIKNALVIPVNESLAQIIVTKPNVVAPFLQKEQRTAVQYRRLVDEITSVIALQKANFKFSTR